MTEKKYLPSLVYAHNTTRHESTGFLPFELMFGRKAKLPIDTALPVNSEPALTTDYIQDLKSKIETTRQIAAEALEQSRKKTAVL